MQGIYFQIEKIAINLMLQCLLNVKRQEWYNRLNDHGRNNISQQNCSRRNEVANTFIGTVVR